MAKWAIQINNFLGGFAPAYYKESYPSYGNKNQAASMLNIDLTNPGYLTQGPGLTPFTDNTGGSASALMTSVLRGLLEVPPQADSAVGGITYGVGETKLYQLVWNYAGFKYVTNSVDFPHVIDNGSTFTGTDAEDVAYYKGNLYYSYNHTTGADAGDIGLYNFSVFNDDWGSTVPTGAAALVYGVPHQICVGGNDTMYIANGRYVASYDGTTFIAQALDIPTGAVIQSIKWNSDRLYISAINPGNSFGSKNYASIYIWDGTTDSWEAEIKMLGSVGGFHVKNGVLFVFYQDVSNTGGYKMGYVSGVGIVDLCNFTGSLPKYYQITDYKDFILWHSNGLIHAYGSGDKDMPARLFQLGDSNETGTTVGCLAAPFGTPITSYLTISSSRRFSYFSGFDVNSNWKSLTFDVTGGGNVPAKIDAVRINFETLQTGARVDWSLKNNQGVTIYSDTISFTKLGAVTSAFYPLNGKVVENFRIEFDYTNGSVTNTVKLKSAKIYGDN